ncbi:MAG: hypothetical protein KFF73_05115 [Cyclobacteriaceae bacterium]|nr:hypothetical protein [Cyclobacteriaceae bacterium]
MNRNAKYENLKTSGRALVIFILLSVWYGKPAYSQPKVPEQIYVHFDKFFYLTGETIHFKIYFLNTATVPSRIVHVDLQNAEGSYILNGLYQVENNMAEGAFNIPYDLEEANYLFRCYTRWNLNFDESYIFSRVIPVYNEFDGNNNIMVDDHQELIQRDSVQAPDTFTRGVSIKIIDTQEHKTNQEIRLEIQTTDRNNQPVPASLSMCVLPVSLIDHPDDLNISDIYNDRHTQVSPDINISYQPEDSIEIKGMAYDPVTGEPINSHVLSIYHVREGRFSRLISKKGSFQFKMPVFEGKTDLQIINMNPFQPKIPDIRWIPLHEEIFRPASIQPVPERDPKIEQYIYYTRLRRKIREIFYETVYDSIQLQQPPLLPFKPDRSYDINQYQLIRNTLDFFREAVTNTDFFRENGEEKLRLFNTETMKFFMTPPWYVVDGHFIFNDSLVHNIPFNHLSRIDIFNRNESIFKYFEPIMIQGGVVAIYTKNNYLIDYIRNMPNTLRVEGITRTVTMEHGHQSGQQDAHETPDFFQLIHWDPNIQTNEEGKTTVIFQSNDVTGNIAIHMEGMDRNGMPVAGQAVIQVRP